jgi:hypothetical protein
VATQIDRASESESHPTARNHAVIAGTGRAGTSFLVEFLSSCGLETGLGTSSWYARARAGHEHRLDTPTELPYVVKDPALFTYCSTLDMRQLAIDALVIPIRDLDQAARSRVHQERLALVGERRSSDHEAQLAGITPGGILYSLDVVDQARILAVGFHKLLHWATINELPLYLLEFPRLVEDRDYTIHKLWPWLGQHCTETAAQAAFAATADAGAVRIRPAESGSNPIDLGAGEPDVAELDRAALLELLDHRTDELEHTRSDANRLADLKRSDAVQLDHLREELATAQSQLTETQAELAAVRSQLQSEHIIGEELAAAIAAERASTASARAQCTQIEQRLTDVTASKSWRFTRPLRAAARIRRG